MRPLTVALSSGIVISESTFGFGNRFMAAAQTAVVPAQQRRSVQTMHRIETAFEALLDDFTFEEITVAQICEAAGCSVGTFYGRIKNKDALLEHLRGRVYSQMQQRIAELLEPDAQDAELKDILRNQMRAFVDLHRTRRGIVRAVILQARRSAALAEGAQAFNQALMKNVTQAWLVHAASMTHPNPKTAVVEAFFMINGYLRERIVFADVWPDPAPNDDAIAEDLTHMVLGYLVRG